MVLIHRPFNSPCSPVRLLLLLGPFTNDVSQLFDFLLSNKFMQPPFLLLTTWLIPSLSLLTSFVNGPLSSLAAGNGNSEDERRKPPRERERDGR